MEKLFVTSRCKRIAQSRPEDQSLIYLVKWKKKKLPVNRLGRSSRAKVKELENSMKFGAKQES